MYGGTYFGSIVFGAGLVVTALTPVPPVTDGNGYGSCYYGSGVYGAGCVVTAQVPVPPTPVNVLGGGYGSCYYGSGVYGAGCIVTSQVPVPPSGPTISGGGGFAEFPFRPRPKKIEDEDDEEIAVITALLKAHYNFGKRKRVDKA